MERKEDGAMLNKENIDLCWQVLSKYGIKHQMNMVIEECSELQKSLCKVFRSDFDISTMPNFHEELVDTIVMCEQMLLAENISMDEVNAMAKVKLERALHGDDRKC